MKLMKQRDMQDKYNNMIPIKLFKNLMSNEGGSVLYIVACLLVVILGMTALVVDIGMLYRERSILQKTVDAATLAGVQYLYGQSNDENDADDVANAYMISNYNGVKGALSSAVLEPNNNKDHKYIINGVINVDYDYSQVDPYEMKTTADLDTNLWFAKVLSDRWKVPFKVSATATAITEPGFGPMPLGIYKDIWDQYYPPKPAVGDKIIMKAQGQDFTGSLTGTSYATGDIPGWFSVVGPDDNKKDITDYVCQGIPGCVAIGSHIYQLQGGTYGNVEPGLECRIANSENDCPKHPDGCPNDPYHIIDQTTGNYLPWIIPKGSQNYADVIYDEFKFCPRLLLVPIVEDVNGYKKEFVISDFIIVYLKDISDKKVIEGWYLGMLTRSTECKSNHRYARLIH
jgi:hypothetical protein